MKKNLYDLKLFESMLISEEMRHLRKIERVPGGWIYWRIGPDTTSTFIPYNEEFKHSNIMEVYEKMK